MPHTVNGKSAGEIVVTHSSIGRIVVPPDVPDGFALFYTTIDFRGEINAELASVVGSPIAECRQVHGAKVLRVEDRQSCLSSTPGQAGLPVLHECDALWSSEKGVALAIKTADCLPVTLIDPAGVTANIHSGWRGTVQRITAATLDAAPLDPATTTAWLGPSIRACCFEVGEEVAVQFDQRWVDRSRGPKPHVDIAAFTANVLRERGIAQVIDTGLCTRCEGSIFHSYRRDKRGGRNLAIVAQ